MLAELATVDEKIKALQAREHAAAIDTIKALMERHHIGVGDIAEAIKPARKQRSLRAANQTDTVADTALDKQRQHTDPRQGELL